MNSRAFSLQINNDPKRNWNQNIEEPENQEAISGKYI